MEELGLFPLGIVLLPTERVPLHIFEPRYKELVGECLELGRELVLLYADEAGIREIGTRARVTDVLERFDDGRLNIVVEGTERVRLVRLTKGRSFRTGLVEPVEDEWDEPDPAATARAVSAFRELAATAGVEAADPDERSLRLSFELAAHVELAADAKQELLELRSERERLARVAVLFEAAARTLRATLELGEHAKRNGSRLGGSDRAS